MTMSHVLGCGLQKGKPEYYRGVQVEATLLPKVQVDMVVSKVPVRSCHRDRQEGPLHRSHRRRQDLRLRRGERGQGPYRRRGLRRSAGRGVSSVYMLSARGEPQESVFPSTANSQKLTPLFLLPPKGHGRHLNIEKGSGVLSWAFFLCLCFLLQAYPAKEERYSSPPLSEEETSLLSRLEDSWVVPLSVSEVRSSLLSEDWEASARLSPGCIAMTYQASKAPRVSPVGSIHLWSENGFSFCRFPTYF